MCYLQITEGLTCYVAWNTDPGEVGKILHNIKQKLLTVELQWREGVPIS